jgi:hypothetical protein
MRRGVQQLARTNRHLWLLERHHALVVAHRALRRKPFDQREHTDHKRALRQHLASLTAHRFDATSADPRGWYGCPEVV